MTSLLDIGPLVDHVTLRDKTGKDVEVEIKGISGEMFLHLLVRFPGLRKLMAGVESTEEIEPRTIMEQVPDAIAVIIAAATGTPNNVEAEIIAAKLGVGTQAEIIQKVWTLTFPRGVANFIAALETLKGQVDVSGWAPDTPSPGQSSNLSQAATQPETSGSTPPA